MGALRHLEYQEILNEQYPETILFAENKEDALEMANSWIKSSTTMDEPHSSYMFHTAKMVLEYIEEKSKICQEPT